MNFQHITTQTNEARALALSELKHLMPQLVALVGTKLYLANGNKSAKNTLKFSGNIKQPFSTCYIDASTYSLWLKISHSKQSDEKVWYKKSSEIQFTIGKLNDGVLTEVRDIETIIQENQLQEVITLDSVNYLKNAIKETRETLHHLERQFPFDKELLNY